MPVTLDSALLLAGCALFVAGELVALAGPGLTASERVRALVRTPVRRLALAVLLVLLYTHIVHSWPW